MNLDSTAASPAFADPSGVFEIECYKCKRKYELHGKESILAICLQDEAWVRDGNLMICPHCPAPRDTPVFNRSREAERKQKRCQN